MLLKKVNESSTRVAKDAVKKLKSNSPKLTGSYAKGWRQKENKFIGQPNTHIIHNKTDYQLTHLLEKGHAKAGGGRVEAIPHVRPAEQEAIEQFTSEVEEAIKNAGTL